MAQYGITILIILLHVTMYLVVEKADHQFYSYQSASCIITFPFALIISLLPCTMAFAASHAISWETLVLLLRRFWTSFLIFKHSRKQMHLSLNKIYTFSLLNHIEFICSKIASGIYQWKRAINSMWRRMFLLMGYMNDAKSGGCIAVLNLVHLISGYD